MTEPGLRFARAGRFENDLLAIVGGADRAKPTLWQSTVGSIGVACALVLTGPGVGLLTTTPRDRPAAVPVPIVVPTVTGVASGIAVPPNSGPDRSTPVEEARDVAGTIAPPATRVIAQAVPSPLRQGSTGRHFADSARRRSGSATTGAQHSPFSDRNQMAASLAQMTDDTGAVANHSAAEQERSDKNVFPSKQSTIAARDALRDLRLR